MSYEQVNTSAQAAVVADGGISVVAAAIVQEGRLLVVSKQAAPDVFYLPGGKPDPGESPEETLVRELDEELGVTPTGLVPLVTAEDRAVLEDVPMHLTVFRAGIGRVPRPAAELARMHWLRKGDISHPAGPVRLAPAIARHVVPLLSLELSLEP